MANRWLIGAVVGGVVSGAVGGLAVYVITPADQGSSKAIYSQVPDTLPDQALRALARGNRSQADELFAQFEKQSTSTVAEVAYQRSRIAQEDEIRYQSAYKHYQSAYEHARRAVRLAPEDSRYLTNAGDLAWKLSDYTAAKDYYKQALAKDLEAHGENHPDVVKNCNNLGLAWQALGEYQKAINCFEQALTSDLKTHREDHPQVKLRRDALESARKELDEYQKAIGYLEQALAVFERKLGPEHPNTRAVRENLAAARARQSVTDAAGCEQAP